MLEQEARRRGFTVPAKEAAKQLQAFEESHAAEVQAMRQRDKVSDDELEQALQSFRQVFENVLPRRGRYQGQRGGPAELRSRGLFEKAKVKVAVFEAAQFEDPAYVPTEAELKEQFEKYKAEDPSSGGEGFGYRLPESVQIEYIQVKAEELAKGQVIRNEEAYEWWKQNMKPTATQPGGQPTTSPAKPFWTFGEAQTEVRKRLQLVKGKHEAMRIGVDLIKALTLPWQNQPTTQPGNYKEPPKEALDQDLYPKTVAAFRQKAGGCASIPSHRFPGSHRLRQTGAGGQGRGSERRGGPDPAL